MGDRAPRSDVVRGTLRKASKVVDAPLRRTEEAVRKIAERPNIDLMDAPHLAWEFIQKGRQRAEKAKEVLDAQVRKRLKEMGLATKEEMDALKRRISELEAAAKHAGERTTEAAGEDTAGSEESADEAPPARARPKAAARPKAMTPRSTRARAKPTGTATKAPDEP